MKKKVLIYTIYLIAQFTFIVGGVYFMQYILHYVALSHTSTIIQVGGLMLTPAVMLCIYLYDNWRYKTIGIILNIIIPITIIYTFVALLTNEKTYQFIVSFGNIVDILLFFIAPTIAIMTTIAINEALLHLSKKKQINTDVLDEISE